MRAIRIVVGEPQERDVARAREDGAVLVAAVLRLARVRRLAACEGRSCRRGSRPPSSAIDSAVSSSHCTPTQRSRKMARASSANASASRNRPWHVVRERLRAGDPPERVGHRDRAGRGRRTRAKIAMRPPPARAARAPRCTHPPTRARARRGSPRRGAASSAGTASGTRRRGSDR